MADQGQGASALKHPDRYTYRDYKTWSDDERWELIDGAAYDMSPAPRWLHQAILTQLSSQLDSQPRHPEGGWHLRTPIGGGYQDPSAGGDF